MSMAVLVNVPSVLNVFLMGSGATGDRGGGVLRMQVWIEAV